MFEGQNGRKKEYYAVNRQALFKCECLWNTWKNKFRWNWKCSGKKTKPKSFDSSMKLWSRLLSKWVWTLEKNSLNTTHSHAQENAFCVLSFEKKEWNDCVWKHQFCGFSKPERQNHVRNGELLAFQNSSKVYIECNRERETWKCLCEWSDSFGAYPIYFHPTVDRKTSVSSFQSIHFYQFPLSFLSPHLNMLYFVVLYWWNNLGSFHVCVCFFSAASSRCSGSYYNTV